MCTCNAVLCMPGVTSAARQGLLPGWLLCDVFDLAASQLQMLRQFIVSHPIVTSRLYEAT